MSGINISEEICRDATYRRNVVAIDDRASNCCYFITLVRTSTITDSSQSRLMPNLVTRKITDADK